MAKKQPGRADQLVVDQLDQRIHVLEQELAADVLTTNSPIVNGTDDLIREAIERRRQRAKPKRKRLAVVLETQGGYIEVAERIVRTLRKHYRYVTFIIPNEAMSAGTVLAMSGDSIMMDYYSNLGPIDPQVPGQDGRRLVPAIGYLEMYNRLIEKSGKGTLTTGEAAILVQRFDPAQPYSYEQARELSVSLLKEWLVKYKFKNWRRTRTRKKRVTRKMREARAEEIARKLQNVPRWRSHARGISMAVAKRELKILIDDFSRKKDINDAIRSYYTLVQDYMRTIRFDGVIHAYRSFRPIRF